MQRSGKDYVIFEKNSTAGEAQYQTAYNYKSSGS